MGRYKKSNTTDVGDTIMGIHESKITDRETDKVGKGAGYTQKEADNEAWKDLKHGSKKGNYILIQSYLFDTYFCAGRSSK